MSNELKIQCCARVYSGFYAHQCKNTGGLEHDGRNYCKAHHPPTIDAKLKAKHDKWQSAHKARMQVFDKAVAFDQLLVELRGVLLDLSQGDMSARYKLESIIEKYDSAK